MEPRVKGADGNRLHFFCPGCKQVHGVFVGDGGWTWNGSLDAPTFHPSVLVQRTIGNGHSREDSRYSQTAEICHSFVTDGQIQFLLDSTHALSGELVDLPPWTND